MKEIIYKMKSEAKDLLQKYFENLSKYLQRQEDLEKVGIVTQNSERGNSTKVDALMNLVKNRKISQEIMTRTVTTPSSRGDEFKFKTMQHDIRKQTLKKLGFQPIRSTKKSLASLDIGNLMVKKLNDRFQMSEYFYYLIIFILLCGQIEQ